jgi:hypothetical protein
MNESSVMTPCTSHEVILASNFSRYFGPLLLCGVGSVWLRKAGDGVHFNTSCHKG